MSDKWVKKWFDPSDPAGGSWSKGPAQKAAVQPTVYPDLQRLRELQWAIMQQAQGGTQVDRNLTASVLKPLPEEHLVAALVGYRAWNVPLFVDELRSVAHASKWLPYQRFEAECNSGQCEGVNCGCGIYAFNKMGLVPQTYVNRDRSKRYVYGECWLWGRVLQCAQGFRAQFAYPKAFVNTGAIAKRMAEIFGVELIKEA